MICDQSPQKKRQRLDRVEMSEALYLLLLAGATLTPFGYTHYLFQHAWPGLAWLFTHHLSRLSGRLPGLATYAELIKY